MRPNNIYIFRHGQSEGNVDKEVYFTKPDYALDLTEKGMEQAYVLGRSMNHWLKGEKIAFYTSYHFRARQTLDNVLLSLKDEQVYCIHQDVRLREQEWGNFGEGNDCGDERDRFGSFFYRFNKGESGADVHDRCSLFLETLYRDFKKEDYPKNVGISCHGFLARVLVMRWLHANPEEFESWKNPSNCQVIKLIKNSKDKYELDPEFGFEYYSDPPYKYKTKLYV